MDTPSQIYDEKSQRQGENESTTSLTIPIYSKIALLSNEGSATENINDLSAPYGRYMFQCVTEGWVKADCVPIEGCEWCDTSDFGGACVTDTFANTVKDWSYFTCTTRIGTKLSTSTLRKNK